MNEFNRQLSRRRFLAAAGLGPLLATSRLYASQDVSFRGRPARVGIIGLGSRGFNLLDAFASQADSEIVALCDCAEEHFRDKQRGEGPAYGLRAAAERLKASGGDVNTILLTSDHRAVLSDKRIEAVVVATPDHWHAPITLEAIAAGKDVY